MNELEKYHNQVITGLDPRNAGTLPQASGFAPAKNEIGPGISYAEIPPEPSSESTSNMIKGILRRWYIVLLTFLLLCLAGIPTIWLSVRPLYNVTGAIRVAPILTSILSGEADKGEISNYQNFMNTQAEIITSNQVVERVADDLEHKNLNFFKNYADYAPSLAAKLKYKLSWAKAAPDSATILKRAISDRIITVAPARRSELVKITMKSPDEQEAKQIVDAFINAYMAVEVASSTQGEDQKLAVLENERRVLAERLQTQRQAIRQLAQEYGTVTLGSRQDMMLSRVASLLAELTKVEAHRINLEAQIQLLEQTKEQPIKPEDLLKMREEYINNDPMVNAVTRNIAQLDQELIVAKQILAPGNPELAHKAQLLEALKLRLEQHKEQASKNFNDLMVRELAKAGEQKLANIKAELEQTKAYEARLRQILAKEDSETIGLGRKQLTIQDLQDQLALTKEMYDTIRRRIQILEMERKRPARISVAYNADIAHIRDKRIKYTMALVFFAMACGMLLAYLRDRADLSLRTPDDVIKRIGIRIIGTTTSPDTIRTTLLAKQVAQDYQTIRANLGLLNSGAMPKKLVVTSAGMRDGKTTFAINLATSMSKSGKKVLLIDGDLRKPDIAQLLNIPQDTGGLQDVLSGKKLEKAVCTIASSGLDVLAGFPSGRPVNSCNSAKAYELLASSQTKQRIDMVSQKYDHVIIDTPPVLAFPDALLWAKIADGVILTSFAGQTTAPELNEAKERLTQIGAKILGTVLSNVRAGYGYYHYGYNYYSQDGQKKRHKTAQNCTKLLLPLHSSEDSG